METLSLTRSDSIVVIPIGNLSFYTLFPCIRFVFYLEPVDPVKPENIVFRYEKTDSALVQWTVSYISYSPETYVVQYGTSRDSLVHNSSLTYSKDGVTTYSVGFSGLRANTTYYVQVLATNTAQRSSRSSIESFTILLNNISSG